MATQKLELRITPAGKDCRLFLDGQEVENCRSVKILAGVDQLTSVTFEIINVHVSVVGEVGDVLKHDVTPMTVGHRQYVKA